MMTLSRLWLLTLIFSYARSKDEKFLQLVSKPYFVDKSLLLETLLSDDTPAHLYISTPRRLGKTTILSMIEKFLKIQVDKFGMPIRFNDTDTYQIFKNLKIRQNRKLFSLHMAQYPVLSFSLQQISKRTYRYSITSLNSELVEALDNILWSKFLKRFFEYHRELFAATHDRDLKFIGKLRKRKLNRHEMENALFVLSRMLYHYFGKTPVIILIDHYDQAALNSFRYDNANITLTYDLINNMVLRALNQGPKYIRNIIMTGVTSLPYSHRSLLPSKVTHMPFLEDHIFTPFFGLSRSELFELFDRYSCDVIERKAIRKYYKAYQTANQKELVYNTYSITRYFMNNKEFEEPEQQGLVSFWRQAELEDGTLPLIYSDPFRNQIKQLLVDRSINYTMLKYHHKESLFQLQRQRESRFKNFERRSMSLFLKIYFEFGYLGYGPESDIYIIPNIEVRQILKHQLRNYQQDMMAITESKTKTTSAVVREDEDYEEMNDGSSYETNEDRDQDYQQSDDEQSDD